MRGEGPGPCTQRQQHYSVIHRPPNENREARWELLPRFSLARFLRRVPRSSSLAETVQENRFGAERHGGLVARPWRLQQCEWGKQCAASLGLAWLALLACVPRRSLMFPIFSFFPLLDTSLLEERRMDVHCTTLHCRYCFTLA